ncbi:MAG: preprotein translocase subunit SecA [Clostridia bacterium]|nr:preprotein translocase subunit SecA [Clostridia bacterium]MBR5045001.1 preprotein translocase subunit SecA [Clostridia bacterium]
MGLFTKIFGTYSDRQLKRNAPIIRKIEDLADKYAAMSDAELQAVTSALKARLAAGETLDDILPDAFAAVREADDRVLGKRPFHVQLEGGVLLHQGRIAEMKTGEGKTLVETMPAYLNALTGEGVHIVTVNDYLARRDSEEMGRVYAFLGLSTGLVVHGQSQEEKHAAYNADITYGTNNEFGFDYLRDNMVIYKERMVQRGHAFAIVDEVDSILIDEARTPLIISGEGEQSTDLYQSAEKFARTLSCFTVKETDDKVDYDDVSEDYIVDEKAKSAVLTRAGIAKAERFFKIDNLSDPENSTLLHHINQAIRAHGIMKRDVDYMLHEGEVIIVDTFTGRLMPGRRYNNGLHQAIEAKENVSIQKESKTLATITFQNYFRMYKKLSGMTGTALTEQDEFREIYALDVVEVPTNMPMIRVDHHDSVYRTIRGKYHAIVEQIKTCHEKGQPILVGTVSIEKSEELSNILNKNGIKHVVLNARHHAREAEIVAQAGKEGAVTISTNMAGRGTDIQLGGNAEFMAKNEMRRLGYGDDMISDATGFAVTDDPERLEARRIFRELEDKYKEEIRPEAERVRAAGGLFILGTERHESRRIDNQLRGRSGRQGDPGESRFFLSLEDDLMRLFGTDRVAGLVARLGLDEYTPINSGILSGSIENAQKRIEAQNFARRKNVLEYDDVMNQQRKLIYDQRREVLDGKDLHETMENMIRESIASNVAKYTQGEEPAAWDLAGLNAEYLGFLLPPDALRFADGAIPSREEITDDLTERAMKIYASKETLFGREMLREVERVILLRNVDSRWMEHIDAMDDLKDSVGLNSYAQRSPISEYRIAGAELFDDMVEDIRTNTVRMLLAAIPTEAATKRVQIANPTVAGFAGQGGKTAVRRAGETVRRTEKKVGPNDKCPCGSGLKYKNCCGLRGGGSGQNG